jgi:heptosyltransferase-2
LSTSPTLVIQTAFLGDVVLTTPLLTILAGRHGPVDVVTTPAAAPLLETHPAVRKVWPHDKRGAGRGVTGARAFARVLATEGYARAYLPHRSWRSAAIAQWAGIPERIGFADSPARVTYTAKVKRPLSGHEVERLVALAGGATAGRLDGWTAGEVPPVSLGLTDDDHARAEGWLREAKVRRGFVALAPGSIWGTKRWPGFEDLARRLGSVVAVGGPDDRALGDAVAAAGGPGSANAAGALPLRASAALIARASVLVTNDSAPLHLATAVGTPIAAVFGPTVPAFGFGPRGPRDVLLEVEGLTCRPCSLHGPQVCPLSHHRCMREISVERVVAAIETVRSER